MVITTVCGRVCWLSQKLIFENHWSRVLDGLLSSLALVLSLQVSAVSARTDSESLGLRVNPWTWPSGPWPCNLSDVQWYSGKSLPLQLNSLTDK